MVSDTGSRRGNHREAGGAGSGCVVSSNQDNGSRFFLSRRNQNTNMLQVDLAEVPGTIGAAARGSATRRPCTLGRPPGHGSSQPGEGWAARGEGSAARDSAAEGGHSSAARDSAAEGGHSSEGEAPFFQDGGGHPSEGDAIFFQEDGGHTSS